MAQSILLVKTLDESLQSCAHQIVGVPKTKTYLRFSSQTMSMMSSSSDIDQPTKGSSVDESLLYEHGKRSSERSMSYTIAPKPSSLTFGSVLVREYPRILGDNPSCSGPPIGIDWVYFQQEKVSLEEYEECRQGKRRSLCMMKIPACSRHQILEDSGFSISQIYKVRQEMQEIRNNRLNSIRDNNSLLIQRMSECARPLMCCTTIAQKKKKQKNIFLLKNR